MSIIVLIRFPVAHRVIVEWASKNMALLEPIDALFTKHGRISQTVVTGASEFLDIDEWPSREAYAAFKAEAAPYIEKFETAFGIASTDEIYDRV